TFGEQTMLRHHDVMESKVRKARAQSVAGLAGAAEADDVRDDDEMPRGVERLARPEQLARKSRLQPGLRRAGGGVDQQHGRRSRRAERDGVLAQLRQRLSAGEAEIADDEIALAKAR